MQWRVSLGALAAILLSVAISPLGIGRSAATQPRLRAGAKNQAPYQMLRPDGGVEGIAVDMLNEAARRENIQIVWVPLPDTSVDDAFRAGLIDLFPDGAAVPERKHWLHVTAPWRK